MERTLHRSAFSGIIIMYLILAVTFSVLLSKSMDRHFDYIVQERIEFGGAIFTASRVLSPVIVKGLVETGLPVRTAALIYITVSTAALLYLFAGLLQIWGGAEQGEEPPSCSFHSCSHGLELHTAQLGSLH